MCIRQAKLNEKYVALSYVNANTKLFPLMSSTVTPWTQHGSLQSALPFLPRVFLDAIDIAWNLDVRYVWIDSLCLVHDDREDMILGSWLVNSVFRGAYVTIVAANASSPKLGLGNFDLEDTGSVSSTPHKPRRSQQRIFTLKGGLSMTCASSLDKRLRRSPYRKRAWTLQEFTLSRRVLVVFEDHVRFRCQQANWSEETWAHNWPDYIDSDEGAHMYRPILFDPMSTRDKRDCVEAVMAYRKLCEEYSRRKLQHSGNALCAFQGICRPLFAKMRTPSLEGLPARHLNYFLLFVAKKGNLQRRAEFPSFSWAGWEGEVVWPREAAYRYKQHRGQPGRRHAVAEDENLVTWDGEKRRTFVRWSELTPSAELREHWRGKDDRNEHGHSPLMRFHLKNYLNKNPGIPKEHVRRAEDWQMQRVFSSSVATLEHNLVCSQWLENVSGREPASAAISFWMLNLVNSEGEFNRLVRAAEPLTPLDEQYLCNWAADRSRSK
jgi:hypothetical protein